jgi:hypothetical protein
LILPAKHHAGRKGKGAWVLTRRAERRIGVHLPMRDESLSEPSASWTIFKYADRRASCFLSRLEGNSVSKKSTAYLIFFTLIRN